MDGLRYCSNCGARMNPTASFCASCGKQVQKSGETGQSLEPATVAYAPLTTTGLQAAPAAQVAAPAPPAETVHLILPGAARHSGFLGLKVESFIVVFTNLRIIFALQTSQMMQENIKRARLEAEQEGKGFFGKWGAQFGANNGKKYWEVPPQQVLAEQPGNFAINREQLRSIRMREDHGDENAVSTYRMEFDTSFGKYKFRFGSLNIRELKKQFQQMYGNVVR